MSMPRVWTETIDILVENKGVLGETALIQEMMARGVRLWGMDTEDIVYEMRSKGIVRIDPRDEKVYLVDSHDYTGKYLPAS